ncbi:MAG TPA: class I adenylate-forming enzyme family protein [Nocardioidaceae bacterium]|nr:class I adenylate-forming enzyme family protein [Nocardioidaceae bacterium]
MDTTEFRSIVDAQTSSTYRDAGWWSDATIDQVVASHADDRPTAVAYSSETGEWSWRQLQDRVTQLAHGLVAVGLRPGDRVAVWMPDCPELHAAFLAAERAGCTIVGLGARAGRRELVHLLERTRASVLVTRGVAWSDDASAVLGAVGSDVAVRHLVVDLDDEEVLRLDGEPVEAGGSQRRDQQGWDELRIGADDLYLINSTSGTTGMPKCVVHTQNRWRYFHQQATANGDLTGDDIFLAAVPAPFGFGQWTSHVTPLLLGATTVLLERFNPDDAFASIERDGVTVLCCVSTQFLMMLASPRLTQHDLSSLRVMFTGGEAVPFVQAREFEERTGVTILQFYGSNETGLLSGTTLSDTPEQRLRTAGRVVPEMQVRLFDGAEDVTETGRGQPACKGPATSVGYLDDPVANDQLFTADGWMLMGDICEIDDAGYLTVVGRTSDFIIRGGKNVSAPQVEADVITHPSIAHAAAVAMPDAVFGERVCVFVELVDGETAPTLDDLTEHLAALGVSKELYPERLIVLDELPRSSGAKVAKGELREVIRRQLQHESTEDYEGAR